MKSQLYLSHPPGFGKTRLAIEWLGEKRLPAYIIGPPNVIRHTWPAELKKWNPGISLHIYGGKSDKAFADMQKADVILISHASVDTFIDGLIDYCDSIKSRVERRSLVCDEVHNLKGGGKRFRAVKALLVVCNKNRLLLSATPMPRDVTDLWAQMYLLDDGNLLGKTKTQFHRDWCDVKYIPGCPVPIYTAHNPEQIMNLVAPYFETAAFKGDEWPPETIYTITGQLEGLAEDVFARLVRDAIDGWHEEPCSIPIAKFSRLRQVQQGFIYSQSKDTVALDGCPRDEQLRTVIQRHPGENVLCIVNYRAETELLKHRFGCPVIVGGMSKNVLTETLRLWNDGRIPLLVAQYATIGEGMNLQTGGSVMFWRCLPLSMKEIEQVNGRLLRRGQTKNVSIYYSVISGVLDDFCIDLCNRKRQDAKSLHDQITSFMEKYTYQRSEYGSAHGEGQQRPIPGSIEGSLWKGDPFSRRSG